MSLVSHLASHGIPPQSVTQANLNAASLTTTANVTVGGQFIDSNQAGMVGAGTTQGTATPITAMNAEFVTVASGTGAVLPAFPAAGFSVTWTVFNNGANALLVYPPTGAKLNALSTNAGFSLAAGKNASFNSVGPTQAYVILSA